MKRTIASLTAVLLAASGQAIYAGEIVWTASGTVTNAAASYGVTAGSPVAIRVSYQSEVLAKWLTALSFPPSTTYVKTKFYGNIGLLTEVRIGTKVWQGWVASQPETGGEVLLTESWDGSATATPDSFTILASSAYGGVFKLFPYTGAQTARSIQLALTDETGPAQFISGGVVPTETAVTSQITKATGFVAAGNERINFTITPASVAVVATPARTSLTLLKTLGGISLGWPSKVGTSYRLEESGDLDGWQPVGTFPGTGNDLIVPLNPFATYPVRRFYRVAEE